MEDVPHVKKNNIIEVKWVSGKNSANQRRKIRANENFERPV